jgi:alcohol dehydrogenase (cytochrome c)
MKLARVWMTALSLSAGMVGQELNPSALKQPATDAWPTYNGDYSGRRNSALRQIDTTNVQGLALQWIYRAGNSGLNGFAGSIKSTPLLVNGTLYLDERGRCARPADSE